MTSADTQAVASASAVSIGDSPYRSERATRSGTLAWRAAVGNDRCGLTSISIDPGGERLRRRGVQGELADRLGGRQAGFEEAVAGDFPGVPGVLVRRNTSRGAAWSISTVEHPAWRSSSGVAERCRPASRRPCPIGSGARDGVGHRQPDRRDQPGDGFAVDALAVQHGDDRRRTEHTGGRARRPARPVMSGVTAGPPGRLAPGGHRGPDPARRATGCRRRRGPAPCCWPGPVRMRRGSSGRHGPLRRPARERHGRSA